MYCLAFSYRPPSIENSLNQTSDTGDFNFNLFNQQTLRKIESISNQFALHQFIDEATHFTETSSSLLDLILISNKDHLFLSRVADPFLSHEVRYHCPIYSLNSLNPNKNHEQDISGYTIKVITTC